MSLSVLSLFAGIGGIDLGLERTGKFQTVAYSEIDDYACRIMQRHFPNAVNIGDMTQIDWTTVQPVDVIVGGFPCQDISLAGKGTGIDGERSGLWTHYADAIRTLRPKGVLVENVAALLHRGIDRVLGDLAACGYDAEWDCIPAAAVGAPHLRDRIFVVAYRPDASKAGQRERFVAHAKSARRRTISQSAFSDACSERPQTNHEPCGSESVASHAYDQRRKERNGSAKPVESEVTSAGCSRYSTKWRQPSGSEWWSVEPDVGRVAHGVSNRMDRLRCLGNAVVPQVAEHVGRILLDRIGEA